MVDSHRRLRIRLRWQNRNQYKCRNRKGTPYPFFLIVIPMFAINERNVYLRFAIAVTKKHRRHQWTIGTL